MVLKTKKLHNNTKETTNDHDLENLNDDLDRKQRKVFHMALKYFESNRDFSLLSFVKYIMKKIRLLIVKSLQGKYTQVSQLGYLNLVTGGEPLMSSAAKL
ncbi:12787_t:CDS:2 [Entrophospora sp. SA101]|nr:12787_t:CDS:2 [Entrophospora sp. SA101]CAJ0827845.1 19642_t:CDS:2 [Entrophospora sp. SA101]